MGAMMGIWSRGYSVGPWTRAPYTTADVAELLLAVVGREKVIPEQWWTEASSVCPSCLLLPFLLTLIQLATAACQVGFLRHGLNGFPKVSELWLMANSYGNAHFCFSAALETAVSTMTPFCCMTLLHPPSGSFHSLNKTCSSGRQSTWLCKWIILNSAWEWAIILQAALHLLFANSDFTIFISF